MVTVIFICHLLQIVTCLSEPSIKKMCFWKNIHPIISNYMLWDFVSICKVANAIYMEMLYTGSNQPKEKLVKIMLLLTNPWVIWIWNNFWHYKTIMAEQNKEPPWWRAYWPWSIVVAMTEMTQHANSTISF